MHGQRYYIFPQHARTSVNGRANAIADDARGVAEWPPDIRAFRVARRGAFRHFSMRHITLDAAADARYAQPELAIGKTAVAYAPTAWLAVCIGLILYFLLPHFWPSRPHFRNCLQKLSTRHIYHQHQPARHTASIFSSIFMKNNVTRHDLPPFLSA